METHHNKRSTFSGKLGFVLSAAGASVGLGNIWRFPYLAAKYGGGIFLLIYIILALTFGYTMIMAETSAGPHDAKKSGRSLCYLWKIQMAVLWRLDQCYYSGADRSVLFRDRRLGHQISVRICDRTRMQQLAADGYFSAFISDGVSTEICFVIFALLTLGIIYAGVPKRY